MSEILLFHHVQGLTKGVRALADALRADGHTVHTPDVFDGETYDSIEEGFAALESRGGPEAMMAMADDVVARLPDELVYIGISLGVMPAQRLAQTRPGAEGAVLIAACVPTEAFGGAELGSEEPGPGWPAGVPVQVHGTERDSFFAGEGDIDAARDLVAAASDGELFVYPGDGHLFVDSSLPDHDAAATALVVERVRGLLARL